MRRLRVFVATVGAALAIGAFPAPAQATHVCLMPGDRGLGLIGETIHRIECRHASLSAVTFFLCELAGVACSE